MIGVYAVALTVALAALRYNRLQMLGGYGIPSIGGAYTNLWQGVNGALFLWPTRRPWQAVSSCIAIVSIIVALVLAPQRTKHWPLFVAALVTVALLCTNLTALLLPRAYSLVTVQGLASGVVVLTADFLPCNPTVLAIDQDARSWWVVPDEVRAWLNTKAAACRAQQEPPPLLNTPAIVWGAYDLQDQHDQSITRWVSDHSVILARRGTKSVTLGFRRRDATPSQAVSIVVTSSTQPVSLTLSSNEWQFATIRLRQTALSWIRQSERVDISVDGWFVPALRDPKSQDLRRLGAEIKMVDFSSAGAQFQ